MANRKRLNDDYTSNLPLGLRRSGWNQASAKENQKTWIVRFDNFTVNENVISKKMEKYKPIFFLNALFVVTFLIGVLNADTIYTLIKELTNW